MSKEVEFTNLIRDHQGLLFKVTSIYTDTKQDQEDLFQEVVFQLWKYFDSFRNESKITTWMYKVAMNTAITFLKKDKRRPDSVSMADTVSQIMEPGNDDVYEERLRLLYAHLKHLNHLDKTLIFLLLEAKSYKEIAEITGLQASNVGTRISRIKQKLKSNMIKS
ncbi:RNA polymerase sigma-70 factor, ECF subfamily [Maribacter sedimenticola]|uniref:RNA polymerase sigma-70 factor, ECF subfamily n=1 Tax=Maribacter sedimenticola TaxID=228956 RepID=A0ABY1SGS3_9FLAO|nr:MULTISPECIES: sigma-70 family RNA polymerase sigma factor [Maribacter]TVZ14255.1 RNA polymerase sigma-70 factor (ECF subfamily) [Maribacter sp. MAR_2009_72]SNR46813.1 RNA polymerase sigma-70 factor, ECF subfamily [Maribacter sedimenticola]